MIHVEGGLVKVGAHILTHSVLSTLPAATQRDDLAKGAAQDWGLKIYMPTSVSGYDG